jgi:hypothetical protein
LGENCPKCSPTQKTISLFLRKEEAQYLLGYIFILKMAKVKNGQKVKHSANLVTLTGDRAVF